MELNSREQFSRSERDVRTLLNIELLTPFSHFSTSCFF